VKTDQSTIEVSRTTGKKKRLLNAQSLSNSYKQYLIFKSETG